jgi:hypothetical protein
VPFSASTSDRFRGTNGYRDLLGSGDLINRLGSDPPLIQPVASCSKVITDAIDESTNTCAREGAIN